MTEQLSAPTRILETAGPAGDCLRRAQLETASLPPLPRFSELRERRFRRVQRRWSALAVGVLLLTVGASHGLRRDERAPSIRAEPTPRLAATPEPVAAALSAFSPETRPAPAPHGKRPPQAASASSSSSRGPVAATLPSAAHKASNTLGVSRQSSGAGQALSAKTCAELVHGGEAQRALDCYASVASGEGISAELALFERARLEAKLLHDPMRALQTLEDYRKRFPSGSLRGEVLLAQIDWLIASGERQRAHALVVEALSSGLVTERTAELERLAKKLEPAESD